MTARRTFGTTLLLASLFSVAFSCAQSPPPKAQEPWPKASRTDYEHKEDSCKEKDGSAKPCTTDDDCCKGYSCGHDPERSRVDHFCIGG